MRIKKSLILTVCIFLSAVMICGCSKTEKTSAVSKKISGNWAGTPNGYYLDFKNNSTEILSSDGDLISSSADNDVILNCADGVLFSYSDTVQKTADKDGNLLKYENSVLTVKNKDGVVVEQKADTDFPDIASVNANSSGNKIILKENSAEISASGAEFKDGVLTVKSGGTYVLSGSLNGGILINANKQKVTLVLNGAKIENPNGAAIYAYKAEELNIILQESSVNSLSDAAAYNFSADYYSQSDGTPNAAVFSKANLNISGGGKLIVNGNYENAINCKDALCVKNCSLYIKAKSNGIIGKDSADFEKSAIFVNSGKDGIKSTNTAGSSVGNLTFSDCNIGIKCANDAFQAQSTLKISGGFYNIISCEGYKSKTTSDSESAKGIKSAGTIEITSGFFAINSADDALHSNNKINTSGGSFVVFSGDDALHADESLLLSGGNFLIYSCYEGIEGSEISFNGANALINASDDGVNLCGGNDANNVTPDNAKNNNQNGNENNGEFSDKGNGNADIPNNGTGKTPPENMPGNPPDDMPEKPNDMPDNMGNPPDDMPDDMPDNSTGKPDMPNGVKNNKGQNPGGGAPDSFSKSSGAITVTDGTLAVNADGDGIDSNGSVEMSGGIVLINGPTSNGDSAIDYETEFSLSGGLLLAVGSSGMAQSVSENSTQNTISYGLENTQNAGTPFYICDGNKKSVCAFTPIKNYSWICFSSDDIKTGSTYSLNVGGTFNGISNYGFLLDSEPSGGEKAAEITVESTVSDNGVGKEHKMGNLGFKKRTDKNEKSNGNDA